MSIFTGISTATLQTWLSEAQIALNELVTGNKVVLLTHEGQRLAFTPAEVPRLKAYIGQLQTAIAINQGHLVGGPASVATWTR